MSRKTKSQIFGISTAGRPAVDRRSRCGRIQFWLLRAKTKTYCTSLGFVSFVLQQQMGFQLCQSKFYVKKFNWYQKKQFLKKTSLKSVRPVVDRRSKFRKFDFWFCDSKKIILVPRLALDYDIKYCYTFVSPDFV